MSSRERVPLQTSRPAKTNKAGPSGRETARISRKSGRIVCPLEPRVLQGYLALFEHLKVPRAGRNSSAPFTKSEERRPLYLARKSFEALRCSVHVRDTQVHKIPFTFSRDGRC